MSKSAEGGWEWVLEQSEAPDLSSPVQFALVVYSLLVEFFFHLLSFPAIALTTSSKI